ncbi:ABC transporter substrate-binding protein [Clostridium thermarum]|uniref:ABC transporter substrate-binding protein n=1 Tax=Clostridium thermarum TaxID=1716543 RepID=UPI001120DEA8|nr:ABC transporter substrate-binding protein [Clostridium thermarum]
MKKLIYMLVVAIFMLTGCVIEKRHISPQSKDYIICNFGELPLELDMPEVDTNNYEGIYTCLFEGLLHMNRDREITEGLAEEWTISDDGLEYSFSLREDAKWNDGTPISADDFIVFFKYILSAKAEDPMASELFPIAGAEDYYKGKINFKDVGIKAVDKNKLEIKLAYEYPQLLEVLCEPRYTLRKSVSKLRLWKDMYKEILYSGPFVIENIDNKGISLTKNENYWKKDYVTDEKFLIITDKSKEEALAELESDKLDILWNPPINEIERVVSSDNAIIINSKDSLVLSFNPKLAATESAIRLRKKIICAIDVDQLRKEGLKEFNPKKYGLFKVIKLYDSIEEDGADNKNSDGDDKEKKTLTLLAEKDDLNKRICKELSKQLKEKAGITLNIKLLADEQLKEEVSTGNYDMLLQRFKGNFGEEYIEKNRKEYLVYPLFKASDVILKNNYIEGIEIDAFDNIVLNKVYQE